MSPHHKTFKIFLLGKEDAETDGRTHRKKTRVQKRESTSAEEIA